MTANDRLRASWRRLRLDLGRAVAGQDLTEPRPVADAVLDALDAEPIIDGAIASAVRLTVEAPELAGVVARLVSGPVTVVDVDSTAAAAALRDAVVELVELAATTAVAEYLQRVAAVVRLETDLHR